MRPPMRLAWRRLFNSSGEAIVIAGTPPDGAAPAGTGVVLIGDAAWAGVVRPAGTDGDGQSARWLVRRGRARRQSIDPDRRVGRVSSVLDRRVGRESSVRGRQAERELNVPDRQAGREA